MPSHAAVSESRYNIEALARGLEVLSLFTPESPALAFSEIVARLRLGKSTAFRTLATLEAMGYVERVASTRQYRPGLKTLELGFTALNGLEVRQVARPHLERLAKETNETTSLAVLDGLQISYLDRIRNRAIVGVILGVGDRVAAHCTSLGKVLLAHLPPEELAGRLAHADLASYTAHTKTDRQCLLAELATVPQLGYAISDEALAIGLRAVAAPIFNARHEAAAAINVSGPVTTITRERLRDELGPLVARTAGQVSRALGAKPEGRWQWPDEGTRSAA